METQVGRKPPLSLSQPLIFYYRENLLTIMYWCRLIPARRHPPAEGYNLLSFTSYHWKGATTPSLKASTLSSTADHFSSIFILDPPISIRHTLSVSRFIYFLYTHTRCRPSSNQRFIIVISFYPWVHHSFRCIS